MATEDVYDLEEFARDHRELVDTLIWATRNVAYGKLIVNLQDGKVIGTEIHRYERRPISVVRPLVRDG